MQEHAKQMCIEQRRLCTKMYPLQEPIVTEIKK